MQSRFNGEFAVHVRMVKALAFVPLADVLNAFEDLSDEIRLLFNNDMNALLDYFEDTYRLPKIKGAFSFFFQN